MCFKNLLIVMNALRPRLMFIVSVAQISINDFNQRFDIFG